MNNVNIFIIRPLLGFLVLAWVSAGVALGSADKKCDPCDDPVYFAENRCACDPVFIQVDPRPGGNLLFQQTEVQMVLQLRELDSIADTSFEREVLAAFDQTLEDPAKVYGAALTVWESGVPANLQRYALLSAIGLVSNTEQKETLRFLLGVLGDTTKAREELTTLANGNGLERRKAGRLLGLILRNPGVQIEDPSA